MIPENRITTHPGEYLREEYAVPYEWTASELAAKLNEPEARIEHLLDCEAGVDAPLAWKLSALLKTTPQFWMNMQAMHDLTKCRPVSEELAAVGGS